jgi:hypothetical protein
LALSVDNEVLRNAILSLALAQYSSKRAVHVRKPKIDLNRVAMEYDVEEHELLAVFRLLEVVLLDLTSFWQVEEVEQSGSRILENLLPGLDGGILLVRSAYWLAVRLGEC